MIEDNSSTLTKIRQFFPRNQFFAAHGIQEKVKEFNKTIKENNIENYFNEFNQTTAVTYTNHKNITQTTTPQQFLEYALENRDRMNIHNFLDSYKVMMKEFGLYMRK